MKIEGLNPGDAITYLQGNSGTEERKVTAEGKQESEVFSVQWNQNNRKMWGESVYEKPQKGLEEIQEEFGAVTSVEDAQLRRDEVIFASNHVSEKDAKTLEEEGYSLTNTRVKTIITETDKIKLQLAKAGVDIRNMGGGLSQEQIEQMTGSVTMAEQLSDMTDGAIKYMLDNQLEPTVENVHRAQYSGSVAYQNTQEIPFADMEQQITKMLSEAGMDVTEQLLESGKWLLENQLPVTPENIEYMSELKNLSLPPKEAELNQAMEDAIYEGKRPEDAMLIQGHSVVSQAYEVADILQEVTEEDIEWIIDNEQTLSVENLRKAIANRTNGTKETWNSRENRKNTWISQEERELALISARRQLEEARLELTAKANFSLLKQGISIETKPLVELVDELKIQETKAYEELLRQDGIAPTPESVEVYQKTDVALEGLKSAPASLIGMPQLDEADLQSLYETARAEEARLKQAGVAYDTMRTEIRRDMGDSIQKAFANVDDILREMDMEATPRNQRAVRILAYNQQEITPEAVQEVKGKDMQVQKTFEALTPSVVREIIRRQENPLDMTMEELYERAKAIQDDLGIQEEERFSKYLWKMDQNGELSGEERSSFLGVYRLISQVEKTDGAAIGSLLQQGADFTMRNLLTQVRSSRKGSMDYVVNDSFGGVNGGEYENSIIRQLEAAFQTDCIREMTQKLTPEKTQKILQNENWMEMTPEQLVDYMDSVEGDTSVAETESAYHKMQIQDLQQCANAEEEVYQLLSDCDMENTVQNILAAQMLLQQPENIYKKFFSREDFRKIQEEILEKFGEAVKTPEEMAEAQEALAETAENVMKTMIQDSDTVTSMDIRQMRMLNSQIALGTARARDEQYAIPVLVGDEVTNVSLKIVRGEKEKGFVDVLLSTESLGQLVARLTKTESGIQGYIATDRRDSVELLESRQDVLEEALGEPTDIQYIQTQHPTLEHMPSATRQAQEQSTEDRNIQTKTLYHMAESLIQVVKGLK